MTVWHARDDQWKRLGHSPVVPARKPLVGAATAGDTAASFAALESQVGALRIRRSYTAAGVFPATFAASTAGIDVGLRESVWSFKPDPADFAAGVHDAWFVAFLDSIPPGHPVIFILWHEPEDNIKDGEFSLAAWQAANARMGRLVHATGRPELRTAICLLGGWTFDVRGPYYSVEYWDPRFDTSIDYIGFDPYDRQGLFTSLADDANLGRALSWASAHGKLVLLPEFGATDDPGGDPGKKAAWIRDTYAFAAASNFYAILYFNIDGSIPGVRLMTEEAISAVGDINAESAR